MCASWWNGETLVYDKDPTNVVILRGTEPHLSRELLCIIGAIHHDLQLQLCPMQRNEVRYYTRIPAALHHLLLTNGLPVLETLGLTKH